MGAKFKVNALAVLALAAAFCYFFMFTKHDPSLAVIIPFGEDPYDSLGSFCLIISGLLAILSLFRAFRHNRVGPPSALRKAFLARTQLAVPLGVLVTLGADGIAMARHTTEWAGRPSTTRLLALVAGMAALSIAVLMLVRRSARGVELPVTRNQARRAGIVVLVSTSVLTIFPEDIIRSVALHFLTIVLGFALIAAPQAALAVAILPFDTADMRISGARPRSGSKSWIQWSAVAILGISVGVFALMGEMFGENEGSGPLLRNLIVSAFFVGSGTAALLIAFAFFKKPLGLFSDAWLT